jgi:hypothetical protein
MIRANLYTKPNSCCGSGYVLMRLSQETADSASCLPLLLLLLLLLLLQVCLGGCVTRGLATSWA